MTCKIWCTQTWHLYSLKIHSSTSYIWVPAVEQPRNSFLLYQPYCAVKNPLSLLRSALEGSTAAGRTAGHKPGQSWQLDKFGGEKASSYHGCRTWRESSNWRSTDSDTWWQESPGTVRQTNGNKEGGKKNHDPSSERPLGKQVMLAKQRRKGRRGEREFSKLRLKEMSAEPAAPAVLKALSCSGCVHPQAPVNSSRCSDLWG